MTVLCAALLFAPVVRIVETVDPGQDRIAIEALVSCEDLGAKDRDDIAVMGKAMAMRSLDFTRSQMAIITGGRPVNCDLTPAGLRFDASVPAGRLKEGIALMYSVLTHPTFDEEDFEKASERLSRTPREGWNQAFDPISHVFRPLKTNGAQLLFTRVFRPEKITLGFGGNFKPGEPLAFWQKRSEEWSVPKMPTGYFDISKPSLAKFNGLNVIPAPLLGVKPLTRLDQDTAATLLAIFSLGVGKDASLFRIVREKLALSYRQEILLVGVPEGLEPRWVIASSQTIPFDVVRADLEADIDTWTEATRVRALAMARGVWKHKLPWNPIVVTGREAGTPLEDETFLNAYWTRLTGLRWDADRLITVMESVPLDELKESARRLLPASPKLR